MTDYTTATKALIIQFLTERLKAMRAQLTPEMAGWEAGTRVPGKAGTMRLGAVTIPSSSDTATVTDVAALTAWAAQYTDGTHDRITPACTADPQIVAWVKEAFPGAVETRIRDAFLDEVKGHVAMFGGYPDPLTGEMTPVPGMVKVDGGKPGSPMVKLDRQVKDLAATVGAPLPDAMYEAVARDVLSLPAPGSNGDDNVVLWHSDAAVSE